MRFTRTTSEGEREPLATSRKWVIGIGAGASVILITAVAGCGSTAAPSTSAPRPAITHTVTATPTAPAPVKTTPAQPPVKVTINNNNAPVPAPVYVAPAPPVYVTPVYVPAGLTDCGAGSQGEEVYANQDTSCPFALNVEQDYAAGGYWNQAGTSQFDAYSPVTGQSYLMTSASVGNPVVVTGGDNALVQFSY